VWALLCVWLASGVPSGLSLLAVRVVLLAVLSARGRVLVCLSSVGMIVPLAIGLLLVVLSPLLVCCGLVSSVVGLEEVCSRPLGGGVVLLVGVLLLLVETVLLHLLGACSPAWRA